MGKKKIIVSVTNDLSTDQRVAKVCDFLYVNNYDVYLVGRQLKKSLPIDNRPYKIKRFRLFFTKGALFYANYNIRLFFFLLFHRFDVLLSNDLDTLLANFLVFKLKRKKRLVYDSHELFTEVPELVSRPKIRAVWLKIERFIFPRLETIITVNKSIATIYKERYGKNLFVLRNVSPLWQPQKIASKSDLDLPEDKKIIILQGSGINVDRGGEEAVKAMQYINNALFIIVGSGDVIPKLKKIVQQLYLEDKVHFIPRIPYQKMMNYTYHADIGLSLDKNTNPNYMYSLPNKIFDYIHTTTPIVCSDLIEIKRVVNTHNVGRIISKYSVQDIAKSINTILEDEQLLSELKENCRKAALLENWEKECKVLHKIYT